MGSDIVLALVWSVMAAAAVCFAISYQDRVPFAAANLTIATQYEYFPNIIRSPPVHHTQ